jgi:hypothetical protein
VQSDHHGHVTILGGLRIERDGGEIPRFDSEGGRAVRTVYRYAASPVFMARRKR